MTRQPFRATMFRRLLVVVASLCVVGVGVYAATVFGEGGGVAPPRQASQASDKDYQVNVKRIEEKLDEVLAAQERTLTRFEDIMEDLRIVKIRVSR